MAKGTSFLSQFPMFVVKLFLSIFHSLPPMILFYSYFIAYKLFLKILQSFKTYPHVSSTLIMSHLWNYWTDLEWICSAEVKNSWSYTSTPPYVLMLWYLVKHGATLLYFDTVASSRCGNVCAWTFIIIIVLTLHECVDWMNLAQDRVYWWAVVNTVMNLWVPYKAGSFLTSWPSSLRRRTLLHIG